MWVLDTLLDAVLDCVKELPFLFLAFFFLEALEHRAEKKMNETLSKAGGYGPLAGALLGCVPQCGFSIMASDFYAGGVISLGTLLAVYLSTSDEALVILLANPGQFAVVFKLLITKVLLGLAAGYAVYAVERVLAKRGRGENKGQNTAKAEAGREQVPDPGGRAQEKKGGSGRKQIRDLCEQDHCGCEHPLVDPEKSDHAGSGKVKRVPWKHLLKPAWHHTREVLLFLFLFTLALNILLELIGMEQLSRIFLADSLFQPVLASLIGLIPNCAASVILTELYLEGVISFGSAVAGLGSAAGLGLVVLWRVNPNRKESARVTGLLLLLAIAGGVICQLIGL